MADAPTILTREPFPWSVFARRHPAIFDQIRRAVPYGPEQLAGFDALFAETMDGVVTPLTDDAPDVADWASWNRDYLGMPWRDTPFLWSESYFYRRLLSAAGYFDGGTWRELDPFGPTKAADLAGPAVDEELAALDHLPEDPSDLCRALLRSSVWGNRADLGFQLIAGSESAGDDLLVDDGAELWKILDGGAPGTVCLVADNAARELLPDLILLDHLLASGRASDAVVFVKPQPYYVSDATTTDLVAGMGRLARAAGRAGQIGRRLWEASNAGRLAVRTHRFFCAPFSYHDAPPEMQDVFASATVTLMKGDLNYRRLVGDRMWPFTTPFAEVTRYFPGPVAALRTLKSDVVVGLDAAVAERLDAAGAGWRTDGINAVVQVRP